MSYIATTAGISGTMVRALIAESIESRFGLIDRLNGARDEDFRGEDCKRDSRPAQGLQDAIPKEY
ncbi:MAG: hypothetical protein ACYTKD_16610 [Planctomycetota bacterium]